MGAEMSQREKFADERRGAESYNEECGVIARWLRDGRLLFSDEAISEWNQRSLSAAIAVVLEAVRGGLSDDVEDAGAEAYSDAREAHKVEKRALYERMGKPMPKGADMCAPTHWLAPTIIAMLDALTPTEGKP